MSFFSNIFSLSLSLFRSLFYFLCVCFYIWHMRSLSISSTQRIEKRERERGLERLERGEKETLCLSLDPLTSWRSLAALSFILSLLHFPSSFAAFCSRSHLGEYVTGTASSFAASATSASVTPPAACVVASTRTRFHSERWKSGWWPAASATSAAAERNATAAAKFFVRKSREREVPSAERRQAGREGSLASRSARERSGVSLEGW